MSTKDHRITNKFTIEARRRGWKMREIADRWGVSRRQLGNTAKSPKQRDWDALAGLPDRNAGQLLSPDELQKIRAAIDVLERLSSSEVPDVQKNK